MRSGLTYVRIEAGNTSAFRAASAYGYNWSVTVSNTTSNLAIYYLRFIEENVYPEQGPSYRHIGNPLRCLSTTAVGM